MSDLITNSTYISWRTLYDLIRSKRYLSFYSDGKRYFLFAFRNKILCLSEWKLCLILCSLTFLGIVGIRKIIKKFRLGKKMRSVIEKVRVRGLSNLVDDKDILHYETLGTYPQNYHPIVTNFFKLTAKSIIKKGHFYKITNRGLLEIVDKMLNFQKKDNVKIISYDTFLLALVIGSTPVGTILFEGTNALVKKIGSSFLLENSPLISALLTAV